jgi:hypothetical protein
MRLEYAARHEPFRSEKIGAFEFVDNGTEAAASTDLEGAIIDSITREPMPQRVENVFAQERLLARYEENRRGHSTLLSDRADKAKCILSRHRLRYLFQSRTVSAY